MHVSRTCNITSLNVKSRHAMRDSSIDDRSSKANRRSITFARKEAFSHQRRNNFPGISSRMGKILTKTAVTISPGDTIFSGCWRTSPKLRPHFGVSNKTGGTRLIKVFCSNCGGDGPGGISFFCKAHNPPRCNERF